MSYAAIAERYARAIFELGAESNQLVQLSDQIRRFADLYASSEDLAGVLDNPVVEETRREALIQDLGTRIGMSQQAVNAVRLLASRHRLRALPEIARQLQTLADDKAGILRATVTSAGPLSESYYSRLSSELEKVTRKRIVLEKEQDPTLIAGVVTKIGDRTIDGSLKGRLSALERELTASSS